VSTAFYGPPWDAHGDQLGAMGQPLRMTFDYALDRRRAHALKLARTDRVLEARQRRLRSHIKSRNRIAAQLQLVHGGSQSYRVIGVGITSADKENVQRDEVVERVIDLAVCRLPNRQSAMLEINP
jgi:hypothetical protein